MTPNAPQPLLPPEHTAQAYAHEQVILRPSQRPGYVEIVRCVDDVRPRRAEVPTMTTDEMKLQRDGQLAYGTPRPAPAGPLHRVVAVTETSVFTTLGDGRGVIEWAR